MSTDRKHSSTSSRRRRLGTALAASTIVVIGLPLAATTASAVIVSPPAGGHVITSFPERDFISAEGYTPGTEYTVNVLRGGFIVGTSAAKANAGGIVEVNHPQLFPDVTNCWTQTTPNIQAGDVIEVLSAPDTGDRMTTANVAVTAKATQLDATTVTLKGTAFSPTGGRILLDELEARVIQKAGFANGTAKLLADSTGAADGTLAYDSPTANTWTATWSGLSAADVTNAVNGESRILWLGAGALGTGTTIFEAGPGAGSIAGGPSLPDCDAPAAQGPSTADLAATSDAGVSSVDNLTNNARPTFAGLTTTGSTATSVDLFVDGSPTPSGRGVVTAGRYSVTPTTALTDGPHRITVGESATATTPLTMSNGSLSIRVDTVKPVVTSHTPLADSITGSQIGNVSARLSEFVSGVNGVSFSLKTRVTNVATPAAVTYNAATREAILNPTAKLAPSLRYTATMNSGVTDLAGNALTQTAWIFKTGAVPTVVAKTPAANVVNVRRLSNVTATFSESVGLTRAKFTLVRTSTGGQLSAAVSYNAVTRHAILNPSTTLLANTKYTATLYNSITDADGNAIPATRWTFTTGAAL